MCKPSGGLLLKMFTGPEMFLRYQNQNEKSFLTQFHMHLTFFYLKHKEIPINSFIAKLVHVRPILCISKAPLLYIYDHFFMYFSYDPKYSCSYQHRRSHPFNVSPS